MFENNGFPTARWFVEGHFLLIFKRLRAAATVRVSVSACEMIERNLSGKRANL